MILFESIRGFWLAFIAAVLALFGLGCAASGWEPGPITDQASSVPIPGLGQATFGGERDTTMVISGMRGIPGANFPDIDNVTLTRSASGPLATRGGQQQAIELLRWQESRETSRQWQQFALSLIPALQEFQAARPAPTPSSGPSVRDELTVRLLGLLEKLEAKIGTQP